jgi:hypothetical protein
VFLKKNMNDGVPENKLIIFPLGNIDRLSSHVTLAQLQKG